MYVDFDFLDEEVRVWMDVHDPKTNSNWMAELYGTPIEIVRQGWRTAKLMDDAGFVPGWRATGMDRGSVDYIILVRDAVERVWRRLFTSAADV